MNETCTNELDHLYGVSYRLRQDAVTMVHNAKTGHAAPALSVAEILTVLYFHEARLDPSVPKWDGRDRIVLSKGHACPIYYAALARRGYFDREELMTYRAFNSRLQGHPDMRKLPGVDMTTGSLGNGVAAALGFAMIGKRENADHRVFAVTGDGELQEGIVWESAMAAGHYRLDNLIMIVDRNGLQSGGDVSQIMALDPLEEKFKAFNWDCVTVDGHDVYALAKAIGACSRNGKPHLIIANTVKGKGVSYMENQFLWHMKAPSDEQYALAMRELNERAEQYE